MNSPNFLAEGERVRALVTIYDLPGQENALYCAAPGDTGVVEHAQEGLFPTVRFDRTGYSTCVTSEEVTPVETNARV